MNWLGLNDIREKYLSFFESKAHTRMASASLVPHGDKSLLLINSGMAPLKKYFLGQAVPPNVRVTTCQKCIRTPDIERVGKTSRHGTYFEMLGNFSFGDYFKNEAIDWAWEFFTEVMEIPTELLYVSVYTDDDEAYDIWTQRKGVSPEHMIRLGKEDNFWEHGSGPCGPCSEIYFDRGEENGCGSPDCKVGCDCDRFVEVWNLVFSQFDSDGNGNYAKMAKPNIDTGMGLERLACVLQGVDNLFEVDTVKRIMQHIMEISGAEYKKDDKTDISLRVITDHIRSTTFMVGDGVLPSNEGRGYVLRRLLRRAARHGRLLGINEQFLYKVCSTVIDENASAYPELQEKREYIKKIIKIEEEKFATTIDKGMELLKAVLDDLALGNKTVMAGDDAFKLHDTYGFPLDLTIEIAGEKNISVDTDRFDELLLLQREKARGDRASKVGSSWKDDQSIDKDIPATEFAGYYDLECDSKIIAIYKDGLKVESIEDGDEAEIILDSTSFYAESGGQVGDIGNICGGGIFNVTNTIKVESGQYIHIGKLITGSLYDGEEVQAVVDKENRFATMRNHTAAHILQAVLREVLGDHVHQAGQLVNADRCRFDFSHFSALTEEELEKVETLANEKIMDALEVSVDEMAIADARKLGAMALFGEKYGDVVRVVNVDGFSIEFCGGTHVRNTSAIGLLKIVSESSVAAGVRRIELVTGSNVLSLLNEYKGIINESACALKLGNQSELVSRCKSVMQEVKDYEKTIAKLNQQISGGKLDGILADGVEINGTSVFKGVFEGTKADVLRQMGDKIKDKMTDFVAVFAGISEDSATFCCICGKDAISKGAHAGKIVQKISAMTGGKGGGRPDSAMAGIGDKDKIDNAMQSLNEVVSEFIG